ncbi:MAG: hypothetical protein AAB426_14580 [Myxococcota bacterium]
MARLGNVELFEFSKKTLQATGHFGSETGEALAEGEVGGAVLSATATAVFAVATPVALVADVFLGIPIAAVSEIVNSLNGTKVTPHNKDEQWPPQY